MKTETALLLGGLGVAALWWWSRTKQTAAGAQLPSSAVVTQQPPPAPGARPLPGGFDAWGSGARSGRDIDPGFSANLPGASGRDIDPGFSIRPDTTGCPPGAFRSTLGGRSMCIRPV